MRPRIAAVPARPRLSRDFWAFWTGQAISNLGSTFTAFALPLLVYKLTGSALNLALTTAATMLPYLLFGLVIGAWVDRVDRKRLMIATDIGRALVIAVIPFLAALHHLSVWAIYGVGFVASTLSISFNAGKFAALPSLVTGDDLVTANGRIQASFSATDVIGPILAGAMVAVVPLQGVLLVDAASFLVSALSLALIAVSFNAAKKRPPKALRREIGEGLRYVFGHPVLRNISLMMALVNLVSSTRLAQLVLFAKHQLRATDPQVAYLYSAGSVGIVVLSLAAGPLRKRFPFSTVALGALMLSGLLTIALALTSWYWVAVALLALIMGLSVLFNINTGSLRQAIVPNEMLGRVQTTGAVLAWSAIPLGVSLGGVATERTHNVALVYGAVGVLVFLIALGFSFTTLGHAARYLPHEGVAPATAKPAAAS